MAGGSRDALFIKVRTEIEPRMNHETMYFMLSITICRDFAPEWSTEKECVLGNEGCLIDKSVKICD